MHADQPLNIGIYCDLGSNVGSGHVMRCLPLAVELARDGLRVGILANFSDDRVQWVRERVIAAGIVPIDATSPNDLVVAVSAAQDAGRPWLTAGIDSYLVTASELAELSGPLFAIDDDGGPELARWRADHPDALFAVVNFNGRGLELEPTYVTQWHADLSLCGPRYIPLDPAYAQLRGKRYRERNWNKRPANMFLLLGGTDATGSTARVVDAALKAAFAHRRHLMITVVTPAEHLRAAINAVAVPAGSRVHAIPPVTDVPQRMAAADIVVTTASTTGWEAACIGTPLVVTSVADNQLPNYHALVSSHLAIGIGDLRSVSDPELAQAFGSIFTSDVNERARRARQLVDGLGAARSAAALRQFFGLTILPASAADSQAIWEWRNDPQTRANSVTSSMVPWEEHRVWFEHTLNHPDRHLLVGTLYGEPIAMLRFDKLNNARTAWEISVNLAPVARGRGLSVPLILAAQRWLVTAEPSAERVIAEIKPHNTTSMQAFAKAGYQISSRTQDLVTLVRNLANP